MGYIIFLILFFFVVVFSQSRETLKKIWHDIEQYEKMRRDGYKPFDQPEPMGASELFYFDLIYFFCVVGFFGCLGYLLGLIS